MERIVSFVIVITNCSKEICEFTKNYVLKFESIDRLEHAYDNLIFLYVVVFTNIKIEILIILFFNIQQRNILIDFFLIIISIRNLELFG